MRQSKEATKKAIIEDLKKKGFILTKCGNRIIPCEADDKSRIRLLHSPSRNKKFLDEISFLKSNLSSLSHFFADAQDIDIKKFTPQLVEVKTNSEMAHLFRLGTLLWSVPVSQGFGRRLRFIVIDGSNGKLVGLFAIGDPVFNLAIRDNTIGWDHHRRAESLYHVMDIFVLGAVPPYAELLCGKLIAMLAASNEIRRAVYTKYLGKETNILRKKKEPHLVLLTTSSALGRSSIYNRIKFRDLLLYQRIGVTKGWGHFHLGDGTFEMMREFLEEIGHPIIKRNRFGQGPNWKMRTIRICLEELGLPAELLRHGISREVYAVPLASNYIQFLLGSESSPEFLDLPATDLVEFFKERWFIPRARRVKKYRGVTREKTLSDLWEAAKDNRVKIARG